MFTDPRIQAEFDANGYVKIPWLTGADVSLLNALYARLFVEARDGFFVSCALPDPGVKAAVRDGIAGVFEPSLRATFVSPIPLQCSFITRTRGDGKTDYIPAHQDWTFVDETTGDVSLNVWCPLEATHARNGNLWIVPASHRLPRHPRLAEPSPTAYQAYYDVLKQIAVPVPTQLGEALVFDNAAIHFSSTNQTESLRLVAGATVIDRSSNPVLYYQNQENAGMLDEYESGPEYFLQRPFGTRPDTFLRSIAKAEPLDVVGEIRRLYPTARLPEMSHAASPEAPRPHAEKERSVLQRLFGRLAGSGRGLRS